MTSWRSASAPRVTPGLDARDRWTLGGRSVDEIQHDIDVLPPLPEGDIDPHPSVIDAAARRSFAPSDALELLGDAPAEPPAGQPAGAHPQLRDLARRLRTGHCPKPLRWRRSCTGYGGARVRSTAW